MDLLFHKLFFIEFLHWSFCAMGQFDSMNLYFSSGQFCSFQISNYVIREFIFFKWKIKTRFKVELGRSYSREMKMLLRNNKKKKRDLCSFSLRNKKKVTFLVSLE